VQRDICFEFRTHVKCDLGWPRPRVPARNLGTVQLELERGAGERVSANQGLHSRSHHGHALVGGVSDRHRRVPPP